VQTFDGRTRKTLELHSIDMSETGSSIDGTSMVFSSASKIVQSGREKESIETVSDSNEVKEATNSLIHHRSIPLSSGKPIRMTKPWLAPSNSEFLTMEPDSTNVMTAVKMRTTSVIFCDSVQMEEGKRQNELLLYQGNEDTLDLSSVSCLTTLELGSIVALSSNSSKSYTQVIHPFCLIRLS
jgi:hypothetical protein